MGLPRFPSVLTFVLSLDRALENRCRYVDAGARSMSVTHLLAGSGMRCLRARSVAWRSIAEVCRWWTGENEPHSFCILNLADRYDVARMGICYRLVQLALPSLFK